MGLGVLGALRATLTFITLTLLLGRRVFRTFFTICGCDSTSSGDMATLPLGNYAQKSLFYYQTNSYDRNRSYTNDLRRIIRNDYMFKRSYFGGHRKKTPPPKPPRSFGEINCDEINLWQIMRQCKMDLSRPPSLPNISLVWVQAVRFPSSPQN
ncbi:hypothetical protein FF38_12882 [Lucilia cuprina]|uniref:Uncharacterized protein n=1 Tax=Lucilia cuprina TaxID=7375 RepID=A0A0L0C072_LUCCU|nr:hypothetical protein FF38_12882 [Lucilia cuprina]